jgi:hypothetical protein
LVTRRIPTKGFRVVSYISSSLLKLPGARTFLIQLDGSLAGSSTFGLNIAPGALGSSVSSLAINNFSSSGISLGAGGTFLAGNYIGVDPTDGFTPRPNDNGISVSSDNNTIGSGTVAGRNIISGNTVDGLIVTGSNNLVIGNYVGTNAGGTAAVANGQYGIAISDLIGFGTASNNTVGGTVAGAGNLISGNTLGGVAMLQILTPVTGNVAQGNFLGTDATGLSALPNQGPGVIIAASDNTIGGTAAAAGNVISGNSSVGVEIEFLASSGNLVAGNLIGVNKNALSPFPMRRTV